MTQRVAAGDLTSDIKAAGRDEVGQMMDGLQHMNASLRQLVGEVRTSTDIITQTSQEIAAGITWLADKLGIERPAPPADDDRRYVA